MSHLPLGHIPDSLALAISTRIPVLSAVLAGLMLSGVIPVAIAGRASAPWRRCPHGVYPRNGAGGPGTGEVEVKGMTCQRAYSTIEKGYITQTEPSNLRTPGFACTAHFTGVASSIKCVHGSKEFKFILGT
jgi:hypothetical protein